MDDEWYEIGSAFKEPVRKCPICGGKAYANWVSVLRGPFEIQVEPFHCDCGWVEGCPYEDDCVGEKCISFHICSNKRKTDEQH